MDIYLSFEHKFEVAKLMSSPHQQGLCRFVKSSVLAQSTSETALIIFYPFTDDDLFVAALRSVRQFDAPQYPNVSPHDFAVSSGNLKHRGCLVHLACRLQ